MRLRSLQLPARQTSIDDRIMPLINIVFLLLIFFLVAGMLREPAPIEAEPPLSAADNENDGEMPSIFVSADGKIALAEGIFPAEEIGPKLAALVAGEGEGIRIVADQAADTVTVIEVIGRLKEAGAGHIRLVTRAREGGE